MEKNESDTLKGLTGAFFTLAIGADLLHMQMKTLLTLEALEIKHRLLEFKKMGVIEIEFINKNNREIEYREIKSFNRFKLKFLRENIKWKCEEEDIQGIKTGRYIFRRFYRKYNKKFIEDICPTCGRSIEDYD
jgi:hypothetical protein